MTVYSAYSSTVSALTLLAGRDPVHPRLYLHNPAVVFAARVNLPDPAEYPVQFVAFDTVTIGDYSLIRPGMTILLGTSAGSDNLGRQRVNDAATTISVFVGRSSRGTHDGELTLVDNAYITVLDDYRLWAKMPYIDSDGNIYKDSGLEVEWRTTEPPPVAIMGPGFAGTIDADDAVITVLFNGQNSYATADGATITDYLWDIGDGTLTGGTLADDNITVTFPAGFRYVYLTVTDSNGHDHTTARPVYARDPDADTSFDGFDIDSIRVTDRGQELTLRILEDMPRATYPDGTLAMIFEREPNSTTDRDHMLLIGWLDVENAELGAGKYGLQRDTTLTVLDTAAKLDSLPGFPQSLADDDTRDTDAVPDITWNYMVTPTMDKYMHYLLLWHSTALEVTDFIWSGTGTDYQIAIKNSDGESLWQQVWRVAQAMCPGYVLTCDRTGTIAVYPDPMLQDSGDRTATVQAAIDEDEYSNLRWTYQRAPRVHWLRTGALVVQSSITFNTDGTVYLPTVFSIAPGDTPGQGLGEVDNNEQLAASQAVLNSATGHRYARLNNALGQLTITLIQDDAAAGNRAPWREIEPAWKEWVTLTLSAANAAQRGLTFATLRCLPTEIRIRYNNAKTGLTRTVEVTLEPETTGEPANTVIKPDIPAVGEQPAPWTPPVDFGPDIYYGNMQAYILWDGLHVMRTWDIGASSPTWALVDTGITGAVYDGQYVQVSANTVGMWLMTADAIWWCDDIMASAPSWTAVLDIATVQAADATPDDGAVRFKTMYNYASEPGYLCVATGPDTLSSENESYQHAYFWHTHDYGANWTQVDMTSPLRTHGGFTHGYMHAGLFAMNIFRSAPGTIWCVRSTPNIGFNVETRVFYSEDLGHTWTEAAATPVGNTGAMNFGATSLLNPYPSITDPLYVVSGSTTPTLQKSTDGFATKSDLTPTGYTSVAPVWRVNKRTFDNDHILAWFLHTATSEYHLLESNDGGTSWTLLYDSNLTESGGTSRHNTPNGWPPDTLQWVVVRARVTGGSTTAVVQFTDDNFGTLQDKSGNLGTLLAPSSGWTNGFGNGFSLPRVGPNT